MCGIVGYAGAKNAAEVLIDGLRHLEYRGYDSAGIAVFEKDGIHVVKSKGRLDDLEAKMQQGGCPKGTTGIGHTRWATPVSYTHLDVYKRQASAIPFR